MRFFDTNILVYGLTYQDLAKREIARALMLEAINQHLFAASTQVMHEFFNVMMKKSNLAFSYQDALSALRFLAEQHIEPHTAQSAIAAAELKNEIGCSWWDALIVEAALRAKAGVLYTEDWQHTRRVRNRLDIVNPFSA